MNDPVIVYRMSFLTIQVLLFVGITEKTYVAESSRQTLIARQVAR